MLAGSNTVFNKVNKRAATSNGIASVHRAIGKISLVCGGVTFLVGLVKGKDYTLTCLFYTFVFICVSLISFTIAELIQILHDIRAKLYKDNDARGKK